MAESDRTAGLFKEYRRVLTRDRFRPEDLDPTRVEYHRPLLARLDSVEGSSVALYDLHERRYAFLTSSFRFLLGYRRDEAMDRGPDYFYGMMHPDDLPVVLDTVIRAFRFLRGLPPEERRDYRLRFDFRMRRAEGGFVRLLQQDRKGRIWLVLIVNDLVRDGSLEAGAGRQMHCIRDGKLRLFRVG